MNAERSKSVVVTGGAGEIGQEAARQFLAEGARVLLVDIDEGALQMAVKKLDSERVNYCRADVTSEEDTMAYVGRAVELYGGVDVLLANAGVEGPVASLAEYDADTFRRLMDINVTGVFLGIKHVFPVMAGGGGGSIVITSSVAGIGGSPGLSAYTTSKHAVIGLMRSAAKEGGPLNIRVNTVNPAPVEGRMISSLEQGVTPDAPEDTRAAMISRIPMGRYGVPADVANLMVFLAGDQSGFLNGGVYMVDGGMTP